MQAVRCPYCEKTSYSAGFKPGKQKCLYCHRGFFVSKDQLKQVTNPNCPVQGWKR